MKHLKIKILFAVAFTISIAATIQNRTDFSGRFKVNKEKTNFEQAPEYILPRYITVSQKGEQAVIARVHLDENLAELPALSDTLKFDGTVFQRGTGTTTLKWLSDTSFQIDKKNGESSVKEVWTLEDSGKTLHLERDVVQNENFRYQTHAFFDRQ